MSITPQDITFMEANRPHYNTLVQAQFLTNIGYDIKEGILNIARKFDPGYMANLWCSPCVCDLVKYAYVQFDKWKEQNVQHATFPVNDKSVGGYQPAIDIQTSPPSGGSGVHEKIKRKYTKRS
jgi:hypothetical protein